MVLLLFTYFEAGLELSSCKQTVQRAKLTPRSVSQICCSRAHISVSFLRFVDAAGNSQLDEQQSPLVDQVEPSSTRLGGLASS